MAQRLKICTQCLSSLQAIRNGQEDLASYLMGIGAGGVEIVPPETCQARITGHKEAQVSSPAETGLADITEGALERAIKSFVKQLGLPEGSSETRELGNAIRAERLKAQELRSRGEKER
jgi:hypothetical protein